MVYLHGGDFWYGSVTTDADMLHDATILAAVGGNIVVTLSYRLDLLGFSQMNTTNIGLQISMPPLNGFMKILDASVIIFCPAYFTARAFRGNMIA